MKPEPPYCQWVCHGFCQRFFHEECKIEYFGEDSKEELKDDEDAQNWKCNDCLENKAMCFCCKEKSVIQIIPKKGKPQMVGESQNEEEESKHGSE